MRGFMCGIFGAINTSGFGLDSKCYIKIKKVAALSERRGSDASGFSFDSPNSYNVFKFVGKISKYLSEINFNFIDEKPTIFLGHTRLSTHGSVGDSENNQPALSENWSVFHNGIVTNYEESIRGTTFEKRSLDTYALVQALEKYWPNFAELQNYLSYLTGEITFVAYRVDGTVIAYTNVGNLFYSEEESVIYLASEKIFLEKVGFDKIFKLKTGTIWSIRDGKYNECSIHLKTFLPRDDFVKLPTPISNSRIADKIEQVFNLRKVQPFNRCTRCLLPSNFPKIEFDDTGECNICKKWKTPILKDMKNFRIQTKSSNKVLLNLSGGRDSCYALLKLIELGFEVVAFTYDWGFISTAARENMANLCGEFGIQHILVSPDLNKNRKLVSRVLQTWLAKPNLAVIPLLMAGDKPFHSESIRISKELGNLPIVQADHFIETTGFKAMLAGARVDFEMKSGGVNYRLNISSILRMAIQYSLFASKVKKFRFRVYKQLFNSFFVYYYLKHDFIRIFDYLTWDEAEMDSLLDMHGWKSNDRSHEARWRMGDSTAPMYNALYLWDLGYSENDAMLSNQVRAGLVSRADALAKLDILNSIDAEGIVQYLEILNVDPQLFCDFLEKGPQDQKIGRLLK
jgi:predicted glutamine amidotransferase